MKYNHSLFIFTRDLRLEDNTALIEALNNSNFVIPIFILNPVQLNDSNKYKSNNSVQFMMESLIELDKELREHGSKLFLFNDEPDKVLDKLLHSDKDIESVYINMDYTPFARNRTKTLRKVCDKYNVPLFEYEDYMLTGCKTVLKPTDKTPYLIFTPFYKAAQKIKVRPIIKNNHHNYVSKNKKIMGEYHDSLDKFYDNNPNILVHGGRKNGLQILKYMSDFKNYAKIRDLPIHETTHLSAYMKFNLISVREVYEAIKKHLGHKSELMRQIYWRDFYMMTMYNHPWVIGGNMKQKLKIKWTYNKKQFDMWKKGKTGIPLIDAGMRQMNTIGWMHNRLRMNVASFLVKILHIDWLQGEKYFAQQLVDYDPANNNGGWQWCASTGEDSQPYFRVFNPWRQSEKIDKDAEYIKKWVPELKDVPAKDIHNWNESYTKYIDTIDYPKPMVNDIKREVKKSIQLYKNK